MEGVIQDYFLCKNCGNKDFKLIYNFSLCFHRVNFSEEMIYDEMREEKFQCTECGEMYTKDQIEKKLSEFKKKRKGT